MADPKDQKIIAVIVSRLALINGSGDYHHNVPAAKIADSRPNWDEEDDLAAGAISVFQGRTIAEEWPAGRRKTMHKMPVLLKFFLKRGTTAVNARYAIADLKKAILGTGSEQDGYLDERFPAVTGTKPGLATEVHETASSIEYAEGTFEIVAAQLEIEVQYLTQKFNAEE